MSKKEDTAFEAWAEEKLSTLPEDQKEKFNTFAQTEAARDMYRGHLREADYYSRLNEFNAEKKVKAAEQEKAAREVANYRTELEGWWNTNSSKLDKLEEENRRLKAVKAAAPIDSSTDDSDAWGTDSGKTSKTGDLAMVNSDYEELKRNQAELRQNQQYMDNIIPQFTAQIGWVVQDSVRNGYDVDVMQVMEYSRTNRVDPRAAYQILTADQRKVKDEKKQSDLEKEWFEKGKREALKSRSPSPDNLTGNAPVWDVLLKDTKTDGSNTELARRASALAMFREESAKEGSDF